MIVGIDTFDNRLDLITWNAFRAWNGGKTGLDGKFTGGDAAFAGRNFTVGNFMWAHAEATDAMKSPQPTNLPAINVVVPLIAPIQAPVAKHQASKLARGYLHGQLDARATCLKVYRSWLSNEFRFPSTGQVNLWLALDSTVTLTAEYWSGWSGLVNSFTSSNGEIVIGPNAPQTQPFRAGLICRYLKNGNKLKRDPDISTILNAPQVPGVDTTCYALWADAPDPDADGVRPNPVLDWTQFDPAEMPDIWRFSTSFRDDTGAPADEVFSLDVVREPENTFQQNATAFMLKTQKWQPSRAQVGQLGYVDLPVNGQNVAIPLSNKEIADTAANPFPNLPDGTGGTVSGGAVTKVGRYLKTPGHGYSFSRDEAERISNANLEIFTVWESHNDAANGEPTMNDPGAANPAAFKIGIAYFDPAFHAGTEDGSNAFSQIGDTLKQPPHTPVYFCVDFDAADPHDTAPVSGADAKKRIADYLALIRDERDKYAELHPGRYYTIGLYSNGGVAGWAYQQGIVSEFWQSVSTGGTGNTPPNRPWYHANRWQFNHESGLNPVWAFVQGADPDADWFDGGTWTLLDSQAQQLADMEAEEVRQFVRKLTPLLQGLIR